MFQNYSSKYETDQHKTLIHQSGPPTENSANSRAVLMQHSVWYVLLSSLLITFLPAQADDKGGVDNRRTNNNALLEGLEHATKIAATADVTQITANQLVSHSLQKIDSRSLNLLIDEVADIATTAALDWETQNPISVASRSPFGLGEPSAQRELLTQGEPPAH